MIRNNQAALFGRFFLFQRGSKSIFPTVCFDSILIRSLKPFRFQKTNLFWPLIVFGWIFQHETNRKYAH